MWFINQTLHFLVKACKLVLDLNWNLPENLSLKVQKQLSYFVWALCSNQSTNKEYLKTQGYDFTPVMTTSQKDICINLPLLHHLKSAAQPAGALPQWRVVWKMSQRHSHVNCSVVGCQNQHASVLSVPASAGQTTRDHCIKAIFIYNVAATLPSTLHVCVKHFAPECFINFGQY